MPKTSFKKDTLAYEERSKYQRQLCCSCGHSLIFHVKENKKICDWCGAMNKNKTLGHFIYNFYKARQKNEKYKTIKLEEEK